MAILIYADMTKPSETVVADTYEQRKAFVGGWAEHCRFPDGTGMIVNETGKLIGLPFNERASALAFMKSGRPDALAGDVVFFSYDEEREYDERNRDDG